ncbi:class II histone deacetylase [Kibdelosporangium phytohabitans]|uniref:Acetoin utilization protein n=1 Tax=Kibdelosporangium phytohabitans TaxID=860235 RepID=A0A0N9I4K6_9PSEU|nr:class II histone deacetylase [Kibdelosporangium phytohabitans]ALG09768.1 acetoin utilization protein [Kibdelosporangium phytohabitans]MBE1468858.1 acetoin utilization deacetylase AcuC-like enzyme [Kibdelosporangium phytohabitans]
MATGYLYHELYEWHDTGTHASLLPADSRRGLQPFRHFENADPKRRAHALVVTSGLINRLTRLTPRRATDEEILLVHTAHHLQRLTKANDTGGDAGDGGTPFGRGSFDIARLALGGLIDSVKAVADRYVDNAYALFRPPGHHAVPDSGMGFCMLANIAVAVRAVRRSHDVRRVAVVDIDVHHGNGTQTVFWEDPDVLTLSLHQDQAFPKNSGFLTERGGGAGFGHNLNLPLPPGTGNGGYSEAMRRVVLPALRRFRPELIMVAAGFDASALDPLGRMMLTATGFRQIATMLVDAADELSDGRIVCAHEGGYAEAYVPFCTHAVIETLARVERPFEDPFRFDTLGQQELQPHQKAAIKAAEKLVKDVQHP